MEITFYFAPMSSAVPVASALAELDVPHRRITFDLKNQDQKQPDFLQLNPNGKVPTVVVDGTPMFESLAILQWLGATFGVDKQLWPAAGTPERLTAQSWATWVHVSYGPVIHQLYLASHESAPGELQSGAWANHARTEAQHLLGILDGQLAKTGHIAGPRYSLADLIVSSMVMWSEMVGVPTADFRHVRSWLDEIKSRPAIRAEWNG